MMQSMYKQILIWVVFLCGGCWMTFAASWKLPGIQIVTRAQWWANENWRYATTSKTDRDALRAQQQEAEMNQLLETDTDTYLAKQKVIYEGQMATDFLIETTPNEQNVDEYRESYSGNYLKWPESIHKNKSKIIIHHTADDYTALLTWSTWTVITQLQAIYKYHALTRWRGDIWYNFLIDPFGTIYEWRAGGAWVVWAHVSWNNTPTVGISLMGNFNVNVPTDASLKSLVKLTTALAKKYAINPKTTATYFKATSDAPYLKTYTNYTIAGHTDAGVTSCPWTNLYALLPEIRNQVSQNLTTTSSSTLVPPTSTKTPLSHGTTVAGRYYAPSTTATFTLPIRWDGVDSCTSKDSTIAITSCKSQNNRLVISLTRKWVSGLKTITAATDAGPKTFSLNVLWQKDFASMSEDIKTSYMNRKWIVSSSSNISKIASKIPLADISSLITLPITILLYELSTNYARYEISCDGWCLIQTDDKSYTDSAPVVEKSNGFIYLNLPTFENSLAADMLTISSVDGGLVYINNYARKSYGGTPWNSFRGSLIRTKDTLKNLASGKYVQQPLVINRTTFDNYMKGIAETSDADMMEKQKTVLLLAKMYTLFYLDGSNVHPSIPAWASYQAIDNPDMFQKYVWAWWEKTSKMSATLLSAIKNTVILYDDYIPILPYFSCSAWFTWSAKEKWWWQDTPYLQSRLDFAACFDFSGHGVGLSGKWAQYLAEKWRTMDQILQYYYPGVQITSL